MWPWEEVGTSAADGILDDETYDWLPIVAAMHSSGGSPVVAPEATVLDVACGPGRLLDEQAVGFLDVDGVRLMQLRPQENAEKSLAASVRRLRASPR